MTKIIIFNNIEFTQIKDFKDYYISKCGKVLSAKKNKLCLRKPCNSDRGYMILGLVNNGISKTFSIHRLVALTFIPNTNKKYEVNHLNGIKHDNSVENLEWCSHKKNLWHSVDVLKNKHGCYGLNNHLSKPVLQIDKKTFEVIKIWGSGSEVERVLGINCNNISSVCTGRTRYAGGFIWDLVENE